MKTQEELLFESEELGCVNMYLDFLQLPTHKNGEKLSTVGRIKQLQQKMHKEMSEVENYYLNSQDSPQ